MEEELKVIRNRKVWELVRKPEGVKTLGTRWVYTLKRDEQGRIVRFKARLVAQGFHQVKGISYDEVFSPVINFALVRLFFSILVNLLGWRHMQLDVKNAYLYAPLKEEIFIRQPQGYVDPDRPQHICKLKKALYGLKQSGREWFFTISETLKKMNFKPFQNCNGVFHQGKDILILLYVDDIVVLGKTTDLIHNTIRDLSKHFDIKILGPTKQLLGVNFTEDNGQLMLDQSKYISQIYNKFKIFNPPHSSLPMSKGQVLSKGQSPSTEDERKEMDQFPYRSLIGCLAYLAGKTRPDIAWAVNRLSQFQENPGRLHWNLLLRVLGYVWDTRKYQLNLSNITGTLEIVAYSDADYAANLDDRTSCSGQLILVGGAPVDWRTIKQRCVALSTMESEFLALTETSKQLVWIKNIIAECASASLFNFVDKVVLLSDNQSAIAFASSPIENNRTKHVAVRHFFVRDLIYQEIFKLKFVQSKNNLADPFTKPQTKEALKRFTDYLFIK